MKRLKSMLLIAVMLSMAAAMNAQTVRFSQLRSTIRQMETRHPKEYIASTGQSFVVGGQLILGTPSALKKFKYVSDGAVIGPIFDDIGVILGDMFEAILGNSDYDRNHDYSNREFTGYEDEYDDARRDSRYQAKDDRAGGMYTISAIRITGGRKHRDVQIRLKSSRATLRITSVEKALACKELAASPNDYENEK